MKYIIILILLISIKSHAEPKGYSFIDYAECSKVTFEQNYNNLIKFIVEQRTKKYYYMLIDFLGCIDKQHFIKIRKKVNKNHSIKYHLHNMVLSNTHPKLVKNFTLNDLHEFYYFLYLHREFYHRIQKWEKEFK